MYKDQYDILGIGVDATEREILLAFRRLARRYHPDVNRGDLGSVEMFNQISRAYQLLSKSDLKTQHDLMGTMTETTSLGNPSLMAHSPESNPGNFIDRANRVPPNLGIDDLVESVMEWGRSSRRSTVEELFQRQRIDIPVNISLEDAYLGNRLSVRIDGSLISRGSSIHNIPIVVPPGIGDGSRIHIARETGRNGTVDVYGLINVKAHKWYKRTGNDLSVKLPVHFAEMILGAQLRLSLLSGNELTFDIPSGTQNGQMLRISGMGMPRINAPHLRGDLLIEVESFLPSFVDEKEEYLLRQIHDLWAKKNPRNLEAPRHAGPSIDSRGK